MTTLTEILCDVWDHCLTADEAREKIDDLFWNKLSDEASVEAAMEETKEKAAKVCMKQQYDLRTRQTFAAAIRSMK